MFYLCLFFKKVTHYKFYININNTKQKTGTLITSMSSFLFHQLHIIRISTPNILVVVLCNSFTIVSFPTPFISLFLTSLLFVYLAKACQPLKLIFFDTYFKFIIFSFKCIVSQNFISICYKCKQDSSNINEGIKAVLFFKRKDFTHTKSTKSTKSTQTSDFHSDVFTHIKSIKSTKSAKRQTSDFLLLRCFLCA